MAFKQWSLYPLNNYSTLFTTWQIKRIKNDQRFYYAWWTQIYIPMGVNSAPLLSNLFRYSYEADFNSLSNHPSGM